MFAKLSALVSSAPSFPYQLVGEPYRTAWGGWKHFKGTSNSDGSAVSIFRTSSTNKQDPKLTSARNGVKRLRTLRHPNVLSFKDTAELDERGETVIYLVTEPVTPLLDVLQTIDMTGPARQEYVAMGLYHIAKAVSFINSDCKLIHANICMRAVVVTETLDWRLHGLDLMTEHMATGDLPLMSASWMVGAQYKPAEIAKCEWGAIQQGPPWAVDSWGLGCLMQEAFNGQEMGSMEELRNTGPIPKPVLQDYQRLLSSQPARRLNPAKLAESSVLKNKLVDTIAFLENLAVKDSSEKDLFFKRLPGAIPDLPLPVLRRKLLPMLAQALTFGGAPAVALGTILQIGSSMDEAEFTERVVPCVSKLFTSTDRSIRRSLLENIDAYGKHLSQSVVEEQIYPNVTTGFTDSNAYLRELTLKSMLTLAPKLSQRTLSNSLLKFLAKLQVDEEAAIRANTTILLGNLAPHLSEATCKRVMLNAFTRALKDSFPPARAAGLKAMMATKQSYAAEEAAGRVIPCVAPLAVDPVSEVRHAALATLGAFLKLLQEHSATMDTAAGAAEGASQQASGGGGWSAGLGSNLGWALSSFGGAKAKDTATGEMSSSRTSTSAASGATSTAFGRPPSPPRPGAQPASSPQPSSGAAPDMFGSTSSLHDADGDGWHDSDGDADAQEEDAEEVAARQRLGRLSTRNTSAQSSKPPAASSTSASTGGGMARQSGASTSGRHIAPPKLSQDDSWAAELDNDDSWDSIDQKNAAGTTGSGRSSAGRRGKGRLGASARGGRLGASRAGSASRGGMKLGAAKLAKSEPDFEF
ncbi:hypothetical protein ABBQ38_001437 [Trebouxia sp. C0009 RCD-2024]